MRIEALESKEAREHFLAEHKGKRERSSSAGILHERQDYDKERPMEGYRENPEKTDEKGNMHEIFRVENAYGSIALGVNKEKEKALVVRRKQNKNGPTVNRNQQELDEEKSYSYTGKAGERELNRFSPISSAYVLKNTDQNEAENQYMGHILMRESEKFGDRTGQHQLLSLLPERTSGMIRDDSMQSMHETIAERMDAALRRELSEMEDEEMEESPKRVPDRIVDSVVDAEGEEDSQDDTDEDEDDENNIF